MCGVFFHRWPQVLELLGVPDESVSLLSGADKKVCVAGDLSSTTSFLGCLTNRSLVCAWPDSRNKGGYGDLVLFSLRLKSPLYFCFSPHSFDIHPHFHGAPIALARFLSLSSVARLKKSKCSRNRARRGFSTAS